MANNHFLLTKKEHNKILNIKTTTLDDTNIDEVINLINICDSVASEYPNNDNAFEEAIRGLRYGLAKYKLNKRKGKGLKLSAYIGWYAKTAIELSMGIDNADTRSLMESIESLRSIN